MHLDEPSWWYDYGSVPIASRLLSPLGRVYGWAAVRRFDNNEPYKSRLPVICIGNFTAGGTGKTPLALHICEELRADGEHPVFLTRGYKGRNTGPLWVDVEQHTAEDVGDEPLLLARAAPTLVSNDRAAGAKFIESGGRRASIIIMDDGMQNPQLAKDLTIAVVDARRGIGNGAVIPAGPLRAPIEFQMGLVNAIVVNGGTLDGNAAAGEIAQNASEKRDHGSRSMAREQLRKLFSGPILRAEVRPRKDVAWLDQTPVVAFSGIANPGRFFGMIESCGANLIATRGFSDHHEFREADAQSLLDCAFDSGARLVTTEKDLVRLSGHGGRRGELRAAAVAFPICLTFSSADDIRVDDLLKSIPGRVKRV